MNSSSNLMGNNKLNNKLGSIALNICQMRYLEDVFL